MMMKYKTEILKNLNIPLARCSLDSSKTNTTGTWLTDVCKNNNLFIVNGRVGKDKGVGRRTFKDISMIDYTLCTADCFTFFKHFEVIELDSIFSDGHALLSWSLDVNHLTCDRQYPTPNLTNPRIKWSESKRDMFVNHIDMQATTSDVSKREQNPTNNKFICTVGRQHRLFKNSSITVST